jgi:hypothetical protein
MLKNEWIEEGCEMVRWTTLICFLGCFGALLLAQASKEPGAIEQAATEKGQAKESAATAPPQPSQQSPAPHGTGKCGAFLVLGL